MQSAGRPASLGVPIATYSIVALDTDSGNLGVAIQSHYFSVGSLAPSAVAGVGASVIQSFPKIVSGAAGIDSMRAGLNASQALARFLAQDAAPEYRQVAMVDAHGGVAVHTGRNCVAAAGHRRGKHYACQANMMRNDSVWGAMAEAYEGTGRDFADRLMAALQGAEEAGGDVRGCQSAALLVVSGRQSGSSLHDRLIDLRVEDHPQPLRELQRLLALQRAYVHNSRGDAHLARKEFDQALEQFAKAEALAPNTPELVFWRAVAMVNAGRADEALPLFARVFAAAGDWEILARRLVDAKLLPNDPDLLQRIFDIADSAVRQN